MFNFEIRDAALISKQVLHRKGIFLVESQTCLESSLLQGTREDCHVKRTRALVENLEKKNNKRFKDPVLWTWQEILDINSKTTYYLLSCRLGSIPAKAYCVLFESQHSKWYHKRLFNEHPRSLYMEPPPPLGGGRLFTCPLTSMKNTSPFIESPEWTTKECFIIWRLPAGLRSISLPF